MKKLGTEKNPAVVRVQSVERATEITELCRERGWHVIAGVEPDEPENIVDLEWLIDRPEPARAAHKLGRNDPCYCGSGKKYKKCCLSQDEALGPGAGERALEPAAPALAGGGDLDAFARPGPSDDRDLPEESGPHRTAAEVSAKFNRQLGPGPFAITPYGVYKLASNPRVAANDEALRQRIERVARDGWTIEKVAAMTTAEIEMEVRGLGVRHSRERFLRLAEGRSSAWSVSEEWTGPDRPRLRAVEIDFLGLAACELWKRFLPERPSIEMIDDWMHEGYLLLEASDPAQACDVWWKIWCFLYPRFERAMTTVNATTPVFCGLQSVFNWCQDFQLELENVARTEPRFATIGRQYCTEWLAQFRDEEDHMQVAFGRSLAFFLGRLGEADEAASVLHGLVEKWPSEVWGYVALADAYAHFFPGAHCVPVDLDKALGYLERGLQLPKLPKEDRKVLEQRRAELRKRTRAARAARSPSG